MKPVRSTLNQLREVVQTQARDLPAGVLAEIRDVELLKRVVLKRSIYGVDLNPMAVELAKLALWLNAFVPGLPLSFLDHNLKRGNSLVGVIGDEVLDALTPEQATIDDPWNIAESLGRATERAREAVERVELRLQDVEAAEEAERERREALREVEALYHRWTAESFDLPGARDRISERDTLEAANDERESAKVAAEQHFFHWPLEFPEVFARERAGFEVVLANPPWDKLKVERHDFFQMRIPGLKFVDSAEDRDRLIDELIARDPRAGDDYEVALAAARRLKVYFRAAAGNYRLHGGGDPDLFKAFAERFLRLVCSRGTVGCVLPRQLLGGAGSEPLRRDIFTRWTVLSADVLWNRRVWAFPDVFHRTRMTLLAARRAQPGAGAAIPSAGPLGDVETFARARTLRIRLPLRQLEAWSPSLELPSLPDPAAGPIFEAMHRHPRFDDARRSWHAIPYCELHSTADRDLYNERGRGWPVWKGATFDRYRPDIAPPVYWAEPDPVLSRLQEKRHRSRAVFDEFPRDIIEDPKTLQPFDCRIVFRDVVRATDRRTMRACLTPPRIFAMEKSPQLVWPRGTPADIALVLAFFNSLPFDWLVRRRVENKMGYGILNSLPLPDDPACALQMSELAARLSCVDERFSDFAERVGVDWGPLSDEDRLEMEAEIDARVARAYGLSREYLEVVFADFVEAALPASYRERVVRHYEATQ